MKPLDVLMVADCLRMLAAALDDGDVDTPLPYKPSRIRELADQLEAKGLGDDNTLPVLYSRLLRWYNSKPRPSAIQAFGSGPARRFAHLVEMAERDASASFEAAKAATDIETGYRWETVGDSAVTKAGGHDPKGYLVYPLIMYCGHEFGPPDELCDECGLDPADGPYLSPELGKR